MLLECLVEVFSLPAVLHLSHQFEVNLLVDWLEGQAGESFETVKASQQRGGDVTPIHVDRFKDQTGEGVDLFFAELQGR